jgi:hypothetical protein
MADESLYRRVLGDQFDQLPGSLYRFHDLKDGGVGQGTFNITRGTGWFRGFLASAMGLPPAGTDVPLQLTVTVDRGRETWDRRFGDHTMKTLQWHNGKLLIEAGGPLRLGFELIADDTFIQFKLIKAWFCLVPIPRFLAPVLKATETACEGGWDVEVEFSLPMLGRLIRYQGRVLVQ